MSRSASRIVSSSCDELRGLRLGAARLLEHLEAVDRRRRLLGDHLGEHVHALHGGLVLLVWHDAHVAERVTYSSGSTPISAAVSRVAVGAGSLGQDLAAEEVAEHVALGGDRDRAVVEAVPALEDRGPEVSAASRMPQQVAVRAARTRHGRGPREVLAERHPVGDRGRVGAGRVDDHRRQAEGARKGVLDRLQRLDADQIRELPRWRRRGASVSLRSRLAARSICVRYPLRWSVFTQATSLLRSGITLPDVELVYVTHGRLSPARDNVDRLPDALRRHGQRQRVPRSAPARRSTRSAGSSSCRTCSATALSTSPSNAPAELAGAHFPLVTHGRQRGPPGAAAARGARGGAGPARGGLVDGRPAGVPLGGALPGAGGAPCRDLRRGADRAAHARIPRGNAGCALRRSRVVAARDPAHREPPRARARLGGLGAQPGLVPARRLGGPRLRVAGGLPRALLGGMYMRARRRRPGGDDPHLAGVRRRRTRRAATTSAAMRSITPARAHARPHRPVLPARGLRGGGRAARRRAARGDPVRLGALRRRRARPR